MFGAATATTTLTNGANSIVVSPVLPQSGSGTRKDFLSKLSVTDSSLAVASGQEHDATTMTATNSVMPMSVSRWIAMKNTASFDKSGTAKIGSIYNATTLGASPVLTEGTKLVPNSAYYADSTWGRDVFLFVERARIESGNAKYDDNLFQLLDPSVNALSNTETTGASKAGKVKALFGFLPPSSTTLAYFAPAYTGTK